MMRSLLVFAASGFLTLSAQAAQAACFQDNETVTLEGVIESRIIEMSPDDFGWVPADGKVPYSVLVVDAPVCLVVDGQESSQMTEIQVGLRDESVGQLSEGSRVRVTGDLFGAHTAHHHTEAVLIIDQMQSAQ